MATIDRRRFCAAIAAASALPLSTVLHPGAAFAAAAAKTPAASPLPSAASGYPAIIGEIRHHTTRYEDSLVDLARKYNLGYTGIVSANPGVDPWVPGAGVEIVLPTDVVVAELDELIGR